MIFAKHLLLPLFILTGVWIGNEYARAQTQTTQGKCSPIVSGNNNEVSVDCSNTTTLTAGGMLAGIFGDGMSSILCKLVDTAKNRESMIAAARRSYQLSKIGKNSHLGMGCMGTTHYKLKEYETASFWLKKSADRADELNELEAAYIFRLLQGFSETESGKHRDAISTFRSINAGEIIVYNVNIAKAAAQGETLALFRLANCEDAKEILVSLLTRWKISDLDEYSSISEAATICGIKLRR